MATFITKPELEKKIAEMQRVADKMLSSKDRVCPVCLSLTRVGYRDKRNGREEECWCDFPGTPMD